MILYHGSNMVFRTPLLAKCSPHKDFGQGFYLSDSFDVARRTALRAVRQRGGEPFVLVFEVDEKKMRQLPFKRFAQLGNRAWAKFVLANRNPGMAASDHNRDRRYSFHTRSALSLLMFKEARHV